MNDRKKNNQTRLDLLVTVNILAWRRRRRCDDEPFEYWISRRCARMPNVIAVVQQPAVIRWIYYIRSSDIVRVIHNVQVCAHSTVT